MTAIANKTIVITGCASGIGRALVLHAIRHGASRVIATDVDTTGLAKTAELARGLGSGTVETHALDVANREAVYALADTVKADFGGADIVINNAGVALFAEVMDMTYDDFEWVMDIDFWGMVYGTKAFLPQMAERGGGHLVNVSSIFGNVAFPGNSAYNAAKFGIRGFTEALRHEMRLNETGIEVSWVQPGGIKTNVARSARLAQKEELLARKDEIARNFDEIAKTTPEEAARVIFDGIEKNRARILIGRDARMMDRIQRLFPASYEWVFERAWKIRRDEQLGGAK